MAHPKRKISKQRRNKRRGNIKLEAKPTYIDPQSGEATLYHRVSIESGFYRGRKVMEGKDD